VYELLGPGLQWSKPQSVFYRAIAQAEKEGNSDAAGHLRIMLKRRNLVMMEKPEHPDH
jgi:hypothetical protein